MSEPNEVSDIIGIIEAEKSAHAPVEEQETIAEPRAEGAESEDSGTTEPEAEKQKDGSSEPENKTEESGSQETGKTAEGQPSNEATPTESEAHSQETKTDAVTDWTKSLPPPPPDYQGKTPEYDPESGQITNMNPDEYTQYIVEKSKADYRKESYNNLVEGRALDLAEQILPELKTNPAVRKMVESTRIASILSGNAIDTVQAAQQVKEALGISSDKILEAKTEGANNAKASIEVQKNAALETGSSKKAESPDRTKELQKRIARGDDLAFAELLDIIDKR